MTGRPQLTLTSCTPDGTSGTNAAASGIRRLEPYLGYVSRSSSPDPLDKW